MSKGLGKIIVVGLGLCVGTSLLVNSQKKQISQPLNTKASISYADYLKKSDTNVFEIKPDLLVKKDGTIVYLKNDATIAIKKDTIKTFLTSKTKAKMAFETLIKGIKK